MIDWAFLTWLGNTYGIWVHDYWLFYLAMVIGAAFIIDTWRRVRNIDVSIKD